MEMKFNGKGDSEMELADAGGEFTNGVAEQAKAPSETVDDAGERPQSRTRSCGFPSNCRSSSARRRCPSPT